MRKEEFFRRVTGKCTTEEVAEKIYLAVHTIYLDEQAHVKKEYEKLWEKEFEKEFTDSDWIYLKENAPVMADFKKAQILRRGDAYNAIRFVGRTLIGLEFDLWLIERYKEKHPLNRFDFRKYMYSKYHEEILVGYSFFETVIMYGINNYTWIAEHLVPYYDDIKQFFEQFCKINSAKIPIKNENVSRLSQVVDNEKEISIESKSQEIRSQEDKKENEDKLDMYSLLISEKDERIERLEQSIKEYQRQARQATEYSTKQFDRGVCELFSCLNDKRFGKQIDYLYRVMKERRCDDEMLGYLENVFYALEDMEIMPIISDYSKFSVNDDTVTKDYNLDFDKNLFQRDQVEVKYVGWTFREDTIIEKPTLKLKGE